MFPIFQSTPSMLAVILVMIAFAFWVQKFKGFKTLGPALCVIITGIILVNFKIVPGSCEIYGTISTYCIPISISLYLLDVDLQQIVKMSKQPLLAIASAVFCVSLVSIIFGILFGNKVDEGWKVAGMFVGTYTGGSSNLTAIATGLNASASTIAAANAADYVIGMPSLILMFLAPTYMKTSKAFQKFWPYSFTEKELEGSGDTKELMESIGNFTVRQMSLMTELRKDPLTGLYNRRSFEESLEKEILQTEETGEKAYIAIFDIDHFKNVNDTYGHSNGDVVIKALCKMLKEKSKDYGLAFRYGGEEFVILFSNIELPKVINVVEDVRTEFRCYYFQFMNNSGITCSCGVAEYSKGESAKAWFNRADNSLYQAKEAGRNRTVVSE